jgi:septal ring factor EnvC (AmiA/AmiB activator)
MLNKIQASTYQGHTRWKYSAKLFILFFFVVCFNLNAAQTPAQKRKELEGKRRELQAAIKRNKSELIKIKAEAFNKEKELKVLGNQISNREKVIANVSQQALEIAIEINNQRANIDRLKVDIEKLKKDYADYLVAVYKRRQNASSLLFFLFESKSLNQAFRRMQYLIAYGNYRQKQATLILNTQKEMIASIEAMLKIKQEKSNLIQAKEIEKQALQKDKEEEGKLLAQLQGKQSELQQKIDRQEKAARKLSHEIEMQIAKEIDLARKAEVVRIEKAKKANQPAAPKTSTSYLSSSDLKLGNDFALSKGKLPWPVAGKMVEGFGDHAHPTLKGIVTTNNGIDIAAKAGSSVQAVFKGTVKAVFPIPGLDKVVLVNHGEYYTVYARLETIKVKIGQEVLLGQEIGTLAVYPETGEGRLHFEIWKQRLFQNPLPWLRVR